MGNLVGEVTLINKNTKKYKKLEHMLTELGDVSKDSNIIIEHKKNKTTLYYNTYSTFSEVSTTLDDAVKKYKEMIKYVDLLLLEYIDDICDSTRYYFNSTKNYNDIHIETLS